MEIVYYILIGLFALDIIVGIISGWVEGKRSIRLENRLALLEYYFEKQLKHNVFPEFEVDREVTSEERKNEKL